MKKLQKKSKNFTMIAGAVALAFGQQAYAADDDGWCGPGKTHIVYSGDKVYDGELWGATDCYEIGAGDIGTPDEYHGTGINLVLEDGAMVNVAGVLKNSDLNSGSEVHISKIYQIAVDGYNKENPYAYAEGLRVNEGSKVYLYAGGRLLDSDINGGTVYVSNQTSDKDKGIAIGNRVNNGGSLYAYLGGQTEGTIVNAGGVEYVQQEGQSIGTTVGLDGKQLVSKEGVANGTIIQSGGLQQVTSKGLIQGGTVEAGGRQNIVNLGKADGVTVYGTQTVFTSDTEGEATNTKVRGSGVQVVKGLGSKAIDVELFDDARQTISQGAMAANVTIRGSAVSQVKESARLVGATKVHDYGRVEMSATQSDGAYAENIELIGANSQVIVLAGAGYRDSVNIDQLNGNGQVRFTSPQATPIMYSSLDVNRLSGNMHFFFNSSIAEGKGDYLNITHGSGQHKVTVADSGVEIAQPGTTSLDLITDRSGDAEFTLADLNGVNIIAVDAGTYMYNLHQREENGTVWYLGAGAYTPPPTDPETGDPSKPGIPVYPGFLPPPLLTTPATDAMLTMSVAPVLMFNNELDSLRTRKGELKDNAGNAGVWGRINTSKTEVDAGKAQFDLDQTGIELGVDRMLETERGQVFIGAHGSYNTADVKHARRGTSKIDSFGVGAYATYFDQSGFYVDGNLKFNRFDNDVRAVSTNGLPVTGSYKQNGMGFSTEVGYNIGLSNAMWVEPYGKLSYVRIGSASTRLNNGMVAQIGNQDSIQSELGVSFGKAFAVNGGTVSPYVKASWVHEYAGSNETTINYRNRFSTNLSGDAGKIGVGVNANLSDERFSLFSELNYTRGDKVDRPVQFNFGMRYNF